jgi:hypothetical protein
MTHPVETPKRLYRKAERGKDEATPLIALTGVTLIVSVAVAMLLTATLLIYFLV